MFQMINESTHNLVNVGMQSARLLSGRCGGCGGDDEHGCRALQHGLASRQQPQVIIIIIVLLLARVLSSRKSIAFGHRCPAGLG